MMAGSHLQHLFCQRFSVSPPLAAPYGFALYDTPDMKINVTFGLCSS